MRSSLLTVILAACLLTACIGNSNKNAATNSVPPPPVANTLAVIVDTGPAAAPGQVNHAYVTVRVCVPGSTTQCATIDHVWLDTGSWGLRLVGSVLAGAAPAVALKPESDAQGNTIEECASFGFGDTWGPVALADVTLAGETAAKLPVQILDDTGTAGAPPPATCGGNGLLSNDVPTLGANGLLGIGVLTQDCGQNCVNSPALSNYYGCTVAGTCTAETIALAAQVTNPVAMFATDNNGLIVNMPALQNPNGDATVQGELVFGLGTQADNALPATGLTVLRADPNTGDFKATYTNGTTLYTSGTLDALLDSGQDSYKFDDPTIPRIPTDLPVPFCISAVWGSYYCPTPSPLITVSVMNTDVNNATSTEPFQIQNPAISYFTPSATAAAFEDLASAGGSTRFTYGMPFFYGRKIYFGIAQKPAGAYTGPFYAY